MEAHVCVHLTLTLSHLPLNKSLFFKAQTKLKAFQVAQGPHIFMFSQVPCVQGPAQDPTHWARTLLYDHSAISPTRGSMV